MIGSEPYLPAAESAALPPHTPLLVRRLHGRWLILARAVWGILGVLTLGLVIASLQATIAERQRQPGQLGVDVTWNDATEPVLWPGPTDTALNGIGRGDVLVAIDGQPVPIGQPLAEVRTRLEGAVGSQVTLSARAQDGAIRQATLTRQEFADYRVAATFGLAPSFLNAYYTLLEAALLLGYLGTGIVIVWRRSDDWLLLFLSLTLILAGPNFSYTYFLLWQAQPGWTGMLDLLSALATCSVLPAFFILPDGRFIPRWTLWLTVGWVAWTLTTTLTPHPPVSLRDWPEWLHLLVDLGWFSAGIGAQIYRYRHVSTPMQRQQTKWVVFGMIVAVLVSYTWQLTPAAFPQVNEPGIFHLLYWLIGRPIFVGGMLLVPVVISIAAFRYRLWDIDLIINRVLIYGVLSGSLLTIYLISVVVLQGVVQTLTGQTHDLTLIVSTLLSAALFQPLRRRVQVFIDTYFYRSTYDVGRTLAAFGATVRDEVDLSAVSEQLLAVVDATMHPAHVGLWLRPAARRQTGQPAHDPVRLRPTADRARAATLPFRSPAPHAGEIERDGG